MSCVCSLRVRPCVRACLQTGFYFHPSTVSGNRCFYDCSSFPWYHVTLSISMALWSLTCCITSENLHLFFKVIKKWFCYGNVVMWVWELRRSGVRCCELPTAPGVPCPNSARVICAQLSGVSAGLSLHHPVTLFLAYSSSFLTPFPKPRILINNFYSRNNNEVWKRHLKSAPSLKISFVIPCVGQWYRVT